MFSMYVCNVLCIDQIELKFKKKVQKCKVEKNQIQSLYFLTL